MMKRKSVLLAASALGLLGVALGAFGAHALKPMLSASGRLETFELAVRYQFYHALALLGCGLLMHQYESRWLRYASISWVAGVFLFSGSLYLLCFTGLSGIAMITPFGGVMMIAGWAMLFVGALNSKK
jgi:uncharacterized membrane protein YgdD (TMEM256/DUF423 family)